MGSDHPSRDAEPLEGSTGDSKLDQTLSKATEDPCAPPVPAWVIGPKIPDGNFARKGPLGAVPEVALVS